MENKENTVNNKIDYQFIPVPRELYYNPEYAALPNDAKHLFILIIDRLRLSEKNIERFSDSNGKAFVYITIEEVMKKLNISEPYAIKLFNILAKSQLINKKRQGLGKPNQIQLGYDGSKLIYNSFLNLTELSSGTKRHSGQEHNLVKGNNNKENNNELNNNQSILYEMAIDDIKEQIDYDYINADSKLVDEIVEIMYDVMYTQANTVRIGANIYPHSAVYKRFSQLTNEDIEYVIEGLERSEKPIQNVKSYLISALYNAPVQSASNCAALFARTYMSKFI